MHLSPNERVLHIFYHHYFPFAITLLKLIGASLPFYFLLFLLANNLSASTIIMIHIGIVVVFTLATVYSTIVYWLDRLVVTNKRVIFIDWKYLTRKSEFEAKLADIQDVRTVEKGILARIPFLDYGVIEIRTASDRTVINFPQAPDPEGIRKFITRVQHQD